MALNLYQVDAFTPRPFAGNPAGVCILPDERPASWMQAVAMEMNLSETAFLVRGAGGWQLRWFTPAVEVDLCGHATLACAHVLGELGLVADGERARFTTRSGDLFTLRQGGWIEMDFPSRPSREAAPPPGLIEALGVKPRWVGRGADDLLVEVGSAAEVRDASPDVGALKAVKARGIILTARSDRDDADFVSRFFAPACGVDEDPVTGSAHCALAPHWAARLERRSMVGYQASRRGGFVGVEVRGERVMLKGQAVTTLRAELLVD